MRRARAGSQAVAVGLLATALVGLPAAVLAQDVEAGPDRGGFSLLASAGFGLQKIEGADMETGLAGLNLGLGGWLTEDLVLWFRASGTSVQYGGRTLTSGAGAAGVQYWMDDRLNLEGGVGFGFWDFEQDNAVGLGFVLGAGYVLFNAGKHDVQIGIEYAPVRTDRDRVHNIGFTLGYQLL